MKPAELDYIRADSSEEACALLAEYGEQGRILAGGQSLMPMLNMRLAQPRALIDVARAQDLAQARIDDGMLRIGAAVTQATVQRRTRLAQEVPLLVQAFPHIGHYQTRNRGTVCGSIAHADPSAELPLCLAVLGGQIALRSASGRRTLAPAQFFQGPLTTARRPDELVEDVRFPLARPGERHGFTEVAMRHGDFAIVSVAAMVSAEEIRLGVGGVASIPWVRRWPRLGDNDLDDALNQLAWELEAHDDVHASAAYRRHLVRTLGKRLVVELQG